MPGMTTLHFRGCGRVIVVVVFGIRLNLRPTHLRGLFGGGFFWFFSVVLSFYDNDFFFLKGVWECSKDENLCKLYQVVCTMRY